MITAGEVTQTLGALVDKRDRIFEEFCQRAEAMLKVTGGPLAESGAHVFSAPGKMLRPLLLLEACRAAGGDPDAVFPAAAGTEYGHIASLIHDDLIDGDDERRGLPTLHVKYDLATAILTGDFLIFETFLSYTECYDHGVPAENVLAAIRTLAATCIDVCRGQALEATMRGNLSTSEDAYLEMIRLKTAAVCRAATRIGALLAGADWATVEALSCYGDNLGIAFQVIDDVLSYSGQPAVIGKPVRSDLRNHRVTLPIIYALQSGDTATRHRISALFEAGDDPDAHDQLGQMLTSSQALDRARAVAHDYTAAAKEQLQQLPPSDARDCLQSLAEIFVTRDR